MREPTNENNDDDGAIDYTAGILWSYLTATILWFYPVANFQQFPTFRGRKIFGRFLDQIAKILLLSNFLLSRKLLAISNFSGTGQKKKKKIFWPNC